MGFNRSSWSLVGAFLLFLLVPKVYAVDAAFDRPQCYAAFKAHKILPESLQSLVKRDSISMFAGLRRALNLSPQSIDQARIMSETHKISRLINGQAPFKKVIFQMGYVSGMVAVFTNPSLGSGSRVQRGFQFYLNKKLDRCLFVFDGHHELLSAADLDAREAWLLDELGRIPSLRASYCRLLSDRYARVNYDWQVVFDERSAVFGVASIYFSNMARLTSHLWYYAWALAHGDLSRTPFCGIGKQAVAR